MKINVFEEICKEWKGYYEVSINKDSRSVIITWEMLNGVLFPDDFKIIVKKAKEEGFIFLYIAGSISGLKLEFYKKY